MEIRKLEYDEYEKLINFIDEAFDKKDGGRFEDILPKLYFKDNKSFIHYGVFDEDILVSVCGVYPDTLVSPYGELKVAGLGAISTKKEYRNKGCFQKIVTYTLEKIKDDYDLIFLSGNRYRYNHFDFENAGRTLIVEINDRTRNALNPKDYEIKDLVENDLDSVKLCLDLYNTQKVRIKRDINSFYKVTRSWLSSIKMVYSNDEFIGYFSLSQGCLAFEALYKDGYRDTLYDAIISLTHKAFVFMDTSNLSEELLNVVDDYKLEHNQMYKILNIDNVLKFLNISSFDYSKYTQKELVKILLGCDEKEGLNGSLHISILDKS